VPDNRPKQLNAQLSALRRAESIQDCGFQLRCLGHIIRVEACDSCGGYLKSIDMTKDAETLPVPDDVPSSAINIWAFELPGHWETFI